MKTKKQSKKMKNRNLQNTGSIAQNTNNGNKKYNNEFEGLHEKEYNNILDSNKVKSLGGKFGDFIKKYPFLLVFMSIAVIILDVYKNSSPSVTS